MTVIQCGMVDKGRHIENLEMVLGTIQYWKKLMIQGTIKTEMMTGITQQGTLPYHTLLITFQKAMLQDQDKEEILLKVIQGFGQDMTIIDLILEIESQDVTVTHHIQPIMIMPHKK